MSCVKDIPYVQSGDVRQVLDLWLPETRQFPVFVYFHGGGLEGGSKEPNCFAQALADRGVCIACANYRLYPKAKFPEFIEDAASAVAWVKNNIGRYGNATQLFVGGSSAGGYLTQMLCFDKRYLARHGIDADHLDGYFMDAGQPTAHFNVLREKGLDTRRVVVDETAPLYFIDGKRPYPPMKILLSQYDMPNRLEQTMLLISTLRHFENDMDKLDFEIIENCGHSEYIGSADFAEVIHRFIVWSTKKMGLM